MSAILSSRSDERLVAAYRGGDRAAFDEIHERYRVRLERFARRLLGRNPEHAEDVVQEAMLRASRALLRDDRPMELKPWLFRIVRNCALDELSRVRPDALDLDTADVGGLLQAGVGSEPSEAFERRAGMREVLEDLADLPEAQRHALLRREVDGLSHEEVAAELGLSVQATKSLVFRARGNLVSEREARTAACEGVRAALMEAADAHRRAPASALRHVAHCAPCRAYRRDLRLQRRVAAFLIPGPLLLLGLGGLKLGSASLAGKGAGTKAAVGTVAAAGAIGLGTTVFGPGDPAPQSVRSPAVPTGQLAAGTPLPAGTAVVRHVLDLSPATTRHPAVALDCPPGLRVADLLTPGGTPLAVSYAAGTTVGADRSARIVFERAAVARRTRVTVSMLCKAPEGGGSIVAADARRIGTPTHRIAVAEALLRTRPDGAVRGTVRRGQPVVVRERSADGAWRRIVTDLGQRGWVRTRALARAGG